MLSATAIQKILNSYEVTVSETKAAQIATYSELLLKWNKRISLTSIEDPEEIVRQHFAESILGTKVAGSLDGRLADVGTGAGFPGLALKIYVPSLSVTLIESNAKKCAFLGEAVRSLGLESVEVLRSRFEDVRLPAAPFDMVTSRALGDIPAFLAWGATVVGGNGRVMLWVGPDGVKEALAYYGTWTWHQPYRLPRTERRFILVGSLKERG
jgi:16S rRNA (guanine527-N7)-methyltransferase